MVVNALAPTRMDFLKLQRNDRAMIRCMFNIRMNNRVSSASLLQKIGLVSFEILIRYNRLRWFGYVERSNGWIKRCTMIEVEGCHGRGRPKKTWEEVFKGDKKEWKVNVEPTNNTEWRKALRTGI